VCIAVYGEGVVELQSITCHMGSHSFDASELKNYRHSVYSTLEVFNDNVLLYIYI